jgi:hypothetical protein
MSQSPMDIPNTELEREVAELRAEVRRLRFLVEGGVLIVGIGLVVLFPSLLVAGIALGAFVLFGFLVSRQRRLIFQSLFTRREVDDVDA